LSSKIPSPGLDVGNDREMGCLETASVSSTTPYSTCQFAQIVASALSGADLGNQLRPSSANYIIARRASNGLTISMIGRCSVEAYCCFETKRAARDTTCYTTYSIPDYGSICHSFGADVKTRISNQLDNKLKAYSARGIIGESNLTPLSLIPVH
jgi:hypothetical protein